MDNHSPANPSQSFRPSAKRSWTSRLASHRVALSILLSALTVGAIAHASVKSIGKSKVQFIAKAPAVTIVGKGSDLTVNESDGTIKITIGLNSMKTGMGDRDDHYRKALNTKKHPKATLEVKRSDLKFPANDKTVESKATGKLTINGTTKPTKFSYKVARTGSDYHVQGLMTVHLKNHKIEPPCFTMICVEKTVKVKVNFKLREN